MSPTESHLKSQVARLKALPRDSERAWGDKTTPGLRDELLRVLWQHSESDEHATAIIDRVLDTVKFCPAPAELGEIADKVAPPGQAKSVEACDRCHGLGFVHTERIVRGERYSMAAVCPCRQGAVLAG